mmetsp:Transcript_34542/g.99467  ORF Transcript_34542/g.99467 Transcript_34542/m.99467 type:complete len:513 (+) Transcript_34542:1080-2618(+)
MAHCLATAVFCCLVALSSAQVGTRDVRRGSNKEFLVAEVNATWDGFLWGKEVVEVQSFAALRVGHFGDFHLEWLQARIEKAMIDQGYGDNQTAIEFWRIAGRVYLDHVIANPGRFDTEIGKANVSSTLAFLAYSTYEEGCLCCKPCNICDEVCSCDQCGVFPSETPTVFQPYIGWSVSAWDESTRAPDVISLPAEPGPTAPTRAEPSPTAPTPESGSGDDNDLSVGILPPPTTSDGGPDASETMTAQDLQREVPSTSDSGTRLLQSAATDTNSTRPSVDPRAFDRTSVGPTPLNMLERSSLIYIENGCPYGIMLVVRYFSDEDNEWKDVCSFRSGTNDDEIVHSNLTETTYNYEVGTLLDTAASHITYNQKAYLWPWEFSDKRASTRYPLIYYAATTISDTSPALHWWGHRRLLDPETNSCASPAPLRPYTYMDGGNIFLHISCEDYSRQSRRLLPSGLRGASDKRVPVHMKQTTPAVRQLEPLKGGLLSLGSGGGMKWRPAESSRVRGWGA